jgi:hypothetical protein
VHAASARLDNAAGGSYRTGIVRQRWRLNEAWIAVERTPPLGGAREGSFADEVAIDFPSICGPVERMCHAFLESDRAEDRLCAEITLSRGQAGSGAAVPLEVPIRCTCRGCGGRGEVWGDACEGCEGTGHALHRQRLTVSVPPGVADGDRFSFSVTPQRGPCTRVEVRVAVT